MSRKKLVFNLTTFDREMLKQRRVGVILLASESSGIAAAAEEFGVSPGFVMNLRSRFKKYGVETFRKSKIGPKPPGFWYELIRADMIRQGWVDEKGVRMIRDGAAEAIDKALLEAKRLHRQGKR